MDGPWFHFGTHKEVMGADPHLGMHFGTLGTSFTNFGTSFTNFGTSFIKFGTSNHIVSRSPIRTWMVHDFILEPIRKWLGVDPHLGTHFGTFGTSFTKFGTSFIMNQIFVKDVPNFVKNVSNFVKDVLNFVKDIPRVPRFISMWGMTFNHYLRVLKK